MSNKEERTKVFIGGMVIGILIGICLGIALEASYILSIM